MIRQPLPRAPSAHGRCALTEAPTVPPVPQTTGPSSRRRNPTSSTRREGKEEVPRARLSTVCPPARRGEPTSGSLPPQVLTNGGVHHHLGVLPSHPCLKCPLHERSDY